MSVRIDIAYEGDLRCAATHGPSGDRLLTDAPTDNEGQGRHFSPTDLVATSLGTCILTIMGIAARKRGFSLEGATVSVVKHMASEPRRHIGRVELDFVLPAALTERQRILLEAVAETCPVAASLGPQTSLDMRFEYRPT
ncbi:MAG: OsmC family protein [Deltaproteobacteria bacterium]|jgi:putative redox protein|nr:OsmC family protein [Deltaproteobacteria bacterium]MBW2533832.1 OsmC family protein [Deltaproteobacteria bacterium]